MKKSIILSFSLVASLFSEIYVVNNANSSIDVFENNATGNVLPKRTIRGNLTTINAPTGIFLQNEEIYISEYSNKDILVFDYNASGNISPKRVLNLSINPENLAIDDNFIYTIDFSKNAAYKYNITDEGSVSALSGIAGDNTLLSHPSAIDVYNNRIYVANNANSSITVYLSSDNGNVSPQQIIHGTKTGLDDVWGIEVTLDEIFVFNKNSIRVFPRDGNGNISPSRVIAGESTYLSGSSLEDSYIHKGKIFVSNWEDDKVLVFNQYDFNNTEPVAVIEGSSINSPYDIYVSNQEKMDKKISINPSIIMYLFN